MSSQRIIKAKIPLPPSMNEQYVNHGAAPANSKTRGRHLTKEARAYKNCLAQQFAYGYKGVKFGKEKICVSIYVIPKNNRRDEFNCEKIVFDALQDSGVIENDRQIVYHEFFVLSPQKPGFWYLHIQPVTMEWTPRIFRIFNLINKREINDDVLNKIDNSGLFSNEWYLRG